jgi:anti-sigma-K factor RskA
MSSAAEHDRYQEDVGAYLLGALADPESEAFERHLETCHVCQDELSRLMTAADALPRSVEQFEPPASLKAALMEQVYAEAEPAAVEAARPKRTLAERLGLNLLRPQFAALAVALLVVGVLAGFGISSLTSDDSGGGSARSVVAQVDSTRVGTGRATLVVPSDGGSGQLRVSGMPQPPAGRVYQVWLMRGQDIEPGPLFSVDRNGNGVAAVPGDLDGVSKVMVTRENRGGALQPTEAPVVTAAL